MYTAGRSNPTEVLINILGLQPGSHFYFQNGMVSVRSSSTTTLSSSNMAEDTMMMWPARPTSKALLINFLRSFGYELPVLNGKSKHTSRLPPRFPALPHAPESGEHRGGISRCRRGTRFITTTATRIIFIGCWKPTRCQAGARGFWGRIKPPTPPVYATAALPALGDSRCIRQMVYEEQYSCVTRDGGNELP